MERELADLQWWDDLADTSGDPRRRHRERGAETSERVRLREATKHDEVLGSRDDGRRAFTGAEVRRRALVDEHRCSHPRRGADELLQLLESQQTTREGRPVEVDERRGAPLELGK